ncbi:MAG: hypothetical protein ACLFNU_11605 [Bacteroidales bacterium]
MKRYFVAGLFFVITIVLVFSCSTSKVTGWLPPTDKFAFVEYYETQEGRAIEGTAPPGMRIDGPTYSFSEENQEINSFLNNEVSKDSLVLLVGRGVILRGTRGGGMHSRLVPAYNIPFIVEKLTVAKMTADGVSFKWNDKDILLAPGESWVNTEQKTDTLINHQGDSAIVENSITHTIKFHGFLKKESLNLQ